MLEQSTGNTRCITSRSLPRRGNGIELRARCPGGAKEGSQGLERSGNPWWILNMDPHPEGMREHPEWRQIALSHPFRMRHSLGTVPGVYASLQPLATISNPFGVKGYISIPERGHFVGLSAIRGCIYFSKTIKAGEMI